MAEEQTTDEPLFDLEKVYDEQIYPLMDEILKICKEHKMPVLASFMYQRTEEDGDGFCTSFLSFTEERKPPKKLYNAFHIIKNEAKLSGTKITVTKADGTQEVTHIVEVVPR